MSSTYPYNEDPRRGRDVPTTKGRQPYPPEGIMSPPHVRDVDGLSPFGRNRENNEQAFQKNWKFSPGAASRLRAATKRALGKFVL